MYLIKIVFFADVNRCCSWIACSLDFIRPCWRQETEEGLILQIVAALRKLNKGSSRSNWTAASTRSELDKLAYLSAIMNINRKRECSASIWTCLEEIWPCGGEMVAVWSCISNCGVKIWCCTGPYVARDRIGRYGALKIAIQALKSSRFLIERILSYLYSFKVEFLVKIRV